MDQNGSAGDLVSLIINCGTPLFLLVLGFLAGRHTERRHLARLDEREAEVGGVMLTTLSRFPSGAEPGVGAVYAEAVIATDYFKEFFAKIVKFFGGELKTYRSLMTRARREAMLKLAEQARDEGFDAVCNIRIATADVGGSTANRKGATMVAVLAWGTAYRRPA